MRQNAQSCSPSTLTPTFAPQCRTSTWCLLSRSGSERSSGMTVPCTSICMQVRGRASRSRCLTASSVSFVRSTQRGRACHIALVTAGGFDHDGTFHHHPVTDTTSLTRLLAEAVCDALVSAKLLDREVADSILAQNHYQNALTRPFSLIF